jgi:hypothetical protein
VSVVLMLWALIIGAAILFGIALAKIAMWRQ